MNLNCIYIIYWILTLWTGLPSHEEAEWLERSEWEKLLIFSENETQEIKVINAIQDCEAYINDVNLPSDYKLQFLFKVRRLEAELNNLDDQFDLKFSQFRYKKGIEILKMIYEKILALDHHFTTLKTFHEIQELSNPHSYPKFMKIKENLKQSTRKKSSVDLPSFLDTNPIVSLGYSLVSSIFGSNDKEERSKDLKEISCLLDFTVSMHSDLKIILYETDYLMVGNEELNQECLQLFKDYTKVIDYNQPLSQCREQDDWDKVFEQLDDLILKLEGKIGATTHIERKQFIQKLNNLEFSIDRLLNFVDSYSDFIKQGEHYYQKFQTILTSYQNKETCITALPKEYHTLNAEIQTSIDKFKNTYNIAELKGSKLRDLLYGAPQL